MTLRKNDIKVLTDVEHVLKRPGIYVGSVKEEQQDFYIYDETNKIVKKELLAIPALLKLFDEVVSNSVDEAIRTDFKFATEIKVNYDDITGEITVKDNGRGLPIEYHETENIWTPELILTRLRSGSNFDDENKGEVMGMNGVGVSLVSILSKELTINTINGSKSYKQRFEDNISKIHEPLVGEGKRNFTEITFVPDYNYFNISNEAKDNLNTLFRKRVKDLSFCYPEITFYYNNEKLHASKLSIFSNTINNVNIINETDKCRIALFKSNNDEFQQMSFVNGADTRRAGTHIDLITGRIVEYLKEYIKKKFKYDVKPLDIKNQLHILFAIRMRAPQFDSQTKERLINNSNDISSTIEELIDKKFLKSIANHEELIDSIVESYKLKQQVKENLELKAKQKQIKKKKIAKLIEPLESDPNKCILTITEGDSAVNSILQCRLPEYGALPLRGKILNVNGMKPVEIIKNKEIESLMNAIGLEFGKKPEDLNFGKIYFMTDMDGDGQAICGLLINFFFTYWPELFKEKRISYLTSPLYTVTNSKETHRFYNKHEYLDFMKDKESKNYKIKYYKGLGSLSIEEYEYMLHNPRLITFEEGEQTKKYIDIIYGDSSDERKRWLSNDI